MADGNPPARPPSYDKKVGLVLQGGGALGSYQAGVYEALASSQYLPDWVAGISIGAINAAIIAGNTPENAVERLRSFWAEITAHTRLWPSSLDGSLAVWQKQARALTEPDFSPHARCRTGFHRVGSPVTTTPLPSRGRSTSDSSMRRLLIPARQPVLTV
jgi:predicted acylesterase/phospholipase RssA